MSMFYFVVESPHCLSFAYHKLDRAPWKDSWYRNGKYNMGKLYVLSRTHLNMKLGGPKLFDTGFGSEGDKWHQAKITIPSKSRHVSRK